MAIFDARGSFLSRLHPGPWLSAPWGVTLAPQDYGEFTHMLLVANHSTARLLRSILFQASSSGTCLTRTATLSASTGYGRLAFADGGIADFTSVMGPYNACYFTAGPEMGQHGLFGNLVPVDSDQTHDEE